MMHSYRSSYSLPFLGDIGSGEVSFCSSLQPITSLPRHGDVVLLVNGDDVLFFLVHKHGSDVRSGLRELQRQREYTIAY